jgi:hypothetical protein
LLKALPKFKEYGKTVFLKAPTELNRDERSDVSWISSETPDRYDHVLFAKGMNDSQFALGSARGKVPTGLSAPAPPVRAGPSRCCNAGVSLAGFLSPITGWWLI